MVESTAQGLLLLVASTLSQAGVGYLPSIRSEADFNLVASPGSIVPGVERTTKLIVPVRDGDPELLPVLFQNINKYPFHYQFLGFEFPDKFPGLDLESYKALCERRATRRYFACLLYRFKGDQPTYGFDIFTGEDAAELPRVEEAKWIYEHVTQNFTIGPVAYSPFNPGAIQNAESWVNPGFPVNFAFGGGFGPYIAYTRAENYGRVRLLTPDGFDEANDSGGFSSQDILVLDVAPSDIEGVVAGVITGTAQEDFSHLSIRTGRRGTPHAYVRDARAAFAPFEGKLVHLVVGQADYEVSEATQEAAEAWWATHRPKPVIVPEVDKAYDQLDAASDIPLDGSLVLNGRYGGKGANFGRLWHIVPEEHRDTGFVIPIHYYFEYIANARVESRANPNLRITLAEYIDQMLNDPIFRSDSRTRFVELQRLRALFEDGTVDTVLVRAIATRIQAIFGRTDGKVRFRSSSNAEHLLEFNGAGLYESTWVCAADDLDTGSAGPSRCDAEESKERGIARGLKKVWGSLWSFRGFEEREYFQIPQNAVGMGILASESFGNVEQANAVAFTGNPAKRGDLDYLVNCQKGDVEVVLPPPGVESEQDLLEIQAGLVTGIRRVRRSTLVPVGERVLSDDQLREVGRVMSMIKDGFPFDRGGYAEDEVLRDIEFKISDEGRLVFKDVRLFVIVGTDLPSKEYHLTIPEGYTLCGSFTEGRAASTVLRGKLMASLRAGVRTLRTDGPSTDDLFDWIDLGENGPRLEPVGPGQWRAELQDRPDVGRVWNFEASQDFLNAGELIRITLLNLNLAVDGPTEVSLDRMALTWPISQYLSRVRADHGDPPDDARHEDFLPCDLAHLPHYTVDMMLADGDAVHLDERFQDLDEGTGPAELVHADVNLTSLGGEARAVEDYWDLVYTAGHHNDSPYPEYWVVFDPPMEILGLGTARALQIVQGHVPPPPTAPPRAYLLAEDFSVLTQLDIVSFVRKKEGVNTEEFRRGDVDFDGQIRITDPIFILRAQFLGEGVITCPDVADVDDQGSIDITDAILLLEYLYLGGPPPEPPFPGCGLDELEDDLTVCVGPGCQ